MPQQVPDLRKRTRVPGSGEVEDPETLHLEARREHLEDPSLSAAAWRGHDVDFPPPAPLENPIEESADGPRLTAALPGEPGEEIGSWPGSAVTAEVSPDGGRLLLQVWDPPADGMDPGESADRLFWSRGRGWRVGERLQAVLVWEAASGATTDLTSKWSRGG